VESRLDKTNRRKWERLHLAIPVFVRTRDGSDNESLEFATAINICAGGALVAVRRSLPKLSSVSLEIPGAPIASENNPPNFPRVIRAKVVWVSHLDDHHLAGLKFERPLPTDTASVA
jgi:hypothetical protein